MLSNMGIYNKFYQSPNCDNLNKPSEIFLSFFFLKYFEILYMKCAFKVKFLKKLF